MQDHPLPQNIASYQFHLVGSMTLKQFLLLATGVVATWVLYSLPIIPIFKWPLMGLSGLGGILFAFIPYQDRSLDSWLTSFLKTIYSPTQYLWKKTPSQPEFLKPSTSLKTTPVEEATPVSSQPLQGYLESLPSKQSPSSIDLYQQQLLQHINHLLQTVPSLKAPTPKPLISPPKMSIEKNLKVKVRKLKTPPPDFSTPPPQNGTTTPLTIASLPPQPSVPTTPLPVSSPTHSQKQFVTATINTRLPFPSASTIPNIIVGMTLDHHRNILENTIIEIRDNKGYPVRALKSNKLGQFYTATPLPSGSYQIVSEKDGFSFDAINIKLEGKIAPPIEITAKPPTSTKSLS